MHSPTLADRLFRARLVWIVAGFFLAWYAQLTLLNLASEYRGRAAFSSELGGDYGEFHSIGVLLERGQSARLYDLGLQDELLHEALPLMAKTDHLPFVYPPFVAPLFRPLSRLPFAWSYATWTILSTACYAASIGLMLRACPDLTASDRRTCWLLALSFEPFALECWMGGQVSPLGCLAVAACLALRGRGRPFLGGIALAFLLYKPTLPLLVVPLLVVGRRWRMAWGFALGAALLALASLALVGLPVCLDFARMMAGYGKQGGSLAEGFRTFKYVDLRAFLNLLGVGREAASPLAMLLAAPVVAGLAVAWARRDGGPRSNLAWAAALCWTPVANVYGPIYDVCLAVPGLILAAGALKGRERGGWPPRFLWLVALAYASGVSAPYLAEGLGFQPLTVALGAMGTYLLGECLKAPVAVGRAEDSPSLAREGSLQSLVYSPD